MLACACKCDATSWVCAEIVLRPYRWADDGWKHARKRSITEKCLYADQDSYADVLPDMASGYMLFPKAWFCLPEVCLMLLHARQSLHHNKLYDII